MKKLVSLLLALTMCASLVACGGPNKQPAIDAHNKAGAAVNEVIEIINQDPDSYADYTEDMASLVDMLNQIGEGLETSKDLNQEDLDEWVEMCGEIEQWAADVKAELGY